MLSSFVLFLPPVFFSTASPPSRFLNGSNSPLFHCAPSTPLHIPTPFSFAVQCVPRSKVRLLFPCLSPRPSSACFWSLIDFLPTFRLRISSMTLFLRLGPETEHSFFLCDQPFLQPVNPFSLFRTNSPSMASSRSRTGLSAFSDRPPSFEISPLSISHLPHLHVHRFLLFPRAHLQPTSVPPLFSSLNLPFVSRGSRSPDSFFPPSPPFGGRTLPLTILSPPPPVNRHSRIPRD